jgi:hypothetical protein
MSSSLSMTATTNGNNLARQMAYRKSIMALSQARNSLFALGPHAVSRGTTERPCLSLIPYACRLRTWPSSLFSQPTRIRTRITRITLHDVAVSSVMAGATMEVRIIMRIRMFCSFRVVEATVISVSMSVKPCNFRSIYADSFINLALTTSSNLTYNKRLMAEGATPHRDCSESLDCSMIIPTIRETDKFL